VTKRQDAGLPQQIDALKQELDTLGNKIYSLNRTRDHLSAASEEMQRLQLKVEEQARKEDEATVLLQSQRLLAVDRLAGTDAPVVPETADEFATFVLDSLKVRVVLCVSKMNEGPHVRGCSGHRTKPRALGRSSQSTLRRK
jgi:predicted RNase H-like nuclease (RuvC/YqgF family)